LGDWLSFITSLPARLDEWAAYLSQVPKEVVLAALSLPIVLAIFSKRVLVFLGCLLFAAVAFCAWAAPSSLPVTFAVGVYLGGLLVAVAGIAARRKAGMLQARLADLQFDMERLMSDQERRYLAKLRASGEKRGG
jgi:hypothetical protein